MPNKIADAITDYILDREQHCSLATPITKNGCYMRKSGEQRFTVYGKAACKIALKMQGNQISN